MIEALTYAAWLFEPSLLGDVDPVASYMVGPMSGVTVRLFPVLWSAYKATGPLTVPWAWLAQFEARALENHCGQTLEKLASRGGLCPIEMWAVAHDRPWEHYKMPSMAQAVAWLNSEPWK